MPELTIPNEFVNGVPADGDDFEDNLLAIDALLTAEGLDEDNVDSIGERKIEFDAVGGHVHSGAGGDGSRLVTATPEANVNWSAGLGHNHSGDDDYGRLPALAVDGAGQGAIKIATNGEAGISIANGLHEEIDLTGEYGITSLAQIVSLQVFLEENDDPVELTTYGEGMFSQQLIGAEVSVYDRGYYVKIKETEEDVWVAEIWNLMTTAEYFHWRLIYV